MALLRLLLAFSLAGLLLGTSSGLHAAYTEAAARLGSTPPTCLSRCGNCIPCLPARVAIKPGMILPLEYYPEAWRCKCGGKLFTP